MARRKPLDQELFEEPYRFEFFQAVRLLERLQPDRESVLATPKPEQEAVRFKGNPSLRFPPSEILEIREAPRPNSDHDQIEMVVNFMGLVGIAGVLPTHYSELVNDRLKYSDPTLLSFLDIFSHRAVSLFYKAWEKYRFPVQYERGNDELTSYFFDVVGLGTDGLRGRMGLDEERLLPYGGLIQQSPHSAAAIEQMLTDYFSVPVRVRQFFGHWLNLDEESTTRLGERNSGLGTEAIVGARVWDQQSMFRVDMGPMPFAEFVEFLPKGGAHEPLKSMIKFMAGLEMDFDLQLELLAKEVPGCVLTTRAQRRPMLGWTSWLKSKPFERDDDQVVLQIPE